MMVKIDNVTFSYIGETGTAGGIREINLSIPDGQFIVLCGESGCGKTTITRLINGLIPHYYEGQLDGKVYVNQKNISEQPLYDTARMIGSVFQNPRSQFFNVDTTSEITFGCENLGIPEEEILLRMERVTQEFHLQKLLGRSIFNLSGGEKQKIACAGVSTMQPDIFVMDEPSSNLDAASIQELRNILSFWKSQGKTIIISEHRLYYLRGLADRFLYLKDGSIENDYTAEQFEQLGEEKRALMGLRTFELGQITAKTYLPQLHQAISLRNFRFSYKNGPEILHIPDCEIPAGEVIAIIGNNGAGKSTFSRCFCGLEKQCGEIFWNGKNLKPKDRLETCYMVMQEVNHQLFTESVRDEITISMVQENAEQAKKIMSGLDLLGVQERHPMSLSGGQKQRVAIASAIASNRSILFLDEPTSGLDFRHMKEVANLLRQLQQDGETVYVITHDLELILECCTHIIHFQDGTIIDQYPVDEAGVQKIRNYFVGENCSDYEKGVQGGVRKMKEESKKESPVATLWGWGKPYHGKFIGSIALAVLGVACQMVPYFCVAHIVTMMLNGEQDFSCYVTAGVIALCGYLGKVLFSNLSTTISHTATYYTLRDLRENITQKLTRVPMGTILDTPSGQYKTTIVDRVEGMEPTFAHLIPEMTANILVPLVIVVYLFVMDWRMALLSLVTLVVGLVVMSAGMMNYPVKWEGAVKAGKEMAKAIVEYIGGIEVVKAFSQSAGSYKKYSDAVNYNANYYVEWMRENQKTMSAYNAILPSVLICILPCGFAFWHSGSLELSTFLSIVIFSLGLVGPIIAAFTFTDDLAVLGTNVDEISQLLNAAELNHKDTPVNLTDTNICLDHVSFSYDGTTEALHDVSFTIRSGTMTALVGPSGSGKSTVAKLIAGYWDVTSGRITLGGHELKEIPLTEVSDQISYVSQDNYLFNRTIRDNIRMGRPGATDAEVEQAAKQSGCDAFIRKLDKGYDTIVGSAGSHLSGGERQRIAIARAMLKNAPVVILDEATAYIDPENEAIVQKAISALTVGKTLIVIAHRLSTITNAENIVVVKDGTIHAQGTHDKLLETCPLYGDMWQAHIGAKDQM